ncbi:DUF544-domain-containing protein [Pholiota conissans]|uniref:DUF544-domain-containing protein n=1 Tax=Pholiota conissans TaxID=109636 RepID=A0A9P5Z9U5_9AGAR|nr:DUF544-domain-containing protein [Pholiota conissans]
MSQTAPTVQSSVAEVWYLKDIKFHGKDLRIITQNFNGPCSFIAICNILILRGNITIDPKRDTVSYEFLSQLVAEYLLTTSPDVDVSAALSVMPYTQKGMDLNPLFTSATSFQPSPTTNGAGGELKLFEHVGIPLIHGWLVDPDSPEAAVIQRIKDYDSAVELIAEVDHLTNGKFVVDETLPLSSTSPGDASSPTREWTAAELQKVQDAIVVRRFLEATQSQLTYHGLFHLATSLAPNTPCAIFRNSHLSVLYKYSPSALTSPPTGSENAAGGSSSSSQILSHTPAGAGETEDSDAALYTLVTDQVFLREPSVVWERLEDVDGGWSTFVDSDFVKSSPAGGDFAGQTAEEALRAAEAIANEYQGTVDPNDLALAQQLQAEEEHIARQEHEAYLREQQERQNQEIVQRAQQQQQQEAASRKPEKVKKEKKKGDCVIM